MEVIKRSELNEALKTQNYRIICESASKKIQTPLDKDFEIFLCHDTEDKTEIKALKAFYENKGIKAYVAEIDDPQISWNGINKKTATVLQNRMRKCRKLYYILSKNSQTSTWMPWEVGYFNGINGAGNIKVLPIIDKNNYEVLDFPGHEYLELYSKEVINFENLRLLKRIDEAKL